MPQLWQQKFKYRIFDAVVLHRHQYGMETCRTVEALQFALYCLLLQIASTRQDEQQRLVNLAATFLFNFRTEMSVVQAETFSLHF
jgi:hypothetical protein